MTTYNQLYQAPYVDTESATVPPVGAGANATTPVLIAPFNGIVSTASYAAAANVNGAAANNRTFTLYNLTQGVAVASLTLNAGVNLAAGVPQPLILSGIATGCSSTAGSRTISGANITASYGFAVGNTVVAPGIPAGATITAITSGVSMTISTPATATNAGALTVTVTTEPNLQVNAGDTLEFQSAYNGTGIADPGGVLYLAIAGVDSHVTSTPYYEIASTQPLGSDPLHLGAASI